MPQDTNTRPLEASIIRDLAGQLSYGEYLSLAGLLAQQKPLSRPPHHDELLFIVQHQVAELWMKLLIHELSAALRHLQCDELDSCFKILSRVKLIQTQLFEMWAVLETLTPNEYLQFRSVLGHASGFQSAQYRKIEFLLGNKDRDLIAVFSHDSATYTDLVNVLESPSLYDEFLRHLARRGLPVPGHAVERDWSLPYQRDEEVTKVFATIYTEHAKWWDAYEMCEKLVDVEEYFQLWRFRHMKTVERIIGFRQGTGGSSGVAFLRRAMDLTFFPELLDVRTHLRQG